MPYRSMIVATFLFANTLHAQCGDASAETLTAEQAAVVAAASDEFKRLGFGGGFAGDFNRDKRLRVQEASLVNNLVRVEKESDVQFSPVLEIHKFVFALKSEKLVAAEGRWVLGRGVFTNCGLEEKTFDVRQSSTVPLISTGPFVVLRLGKEDFVEAFGVGVMTGFRTAKSDNSLNLGVAYGVNPSARVLGDDISDGAKLPVGETEIRYRFVHQKSWLLTFSIGW